MKKMKLFHNCGCPITVGSLYSKLEEMLAISQVNEREMLFKLRNNGGIYLNTFIFKTELFPRSGS